MESRLKLALNLGRHGCDPFQIVTFLEMHRSLRGCKSVLDVGCGQASPLRWFGIDHLVGIDGYEPSITTARQNATHHKLIVGDIREMARLFKPGSFDACVALDVIEHLPKENGLTLARDMEIIAAHKTVFFTPKGFLPQHHAEKTDLQEHLSGWEPHEMRALGYRVIGMLGPKRLRGEYHILKHRPRAFWAVVSLMAHLAWTRQHPEHAAAILCVKRKGRV